MGSKGKTTTGWRRRYLVQRFHPDKKVRVRMLRGRMKKQKSDVIHALLCDQRGGKWYWDGVTANEFSLPWVQTDVLDGDSPDELMTMVAGLRLQGWTIQGGVPLW